MPAPTVFTKISELNELATAPAADDVVPINDTSATETKKLTIANLLGGLQEAYARGNAVSVSGGNPVLIQNIADTTDALNISRTFAGSGDGIQIDMGASATGAGLRIAMNNTSFPGAALNITVPSGERILFGTDGSDQAIIRPEQIEIGRAVLGGGTVTDPAVELGNGSETGIYADEIAEDPGAAAVIVTQAGVDEIALRAGTPVGIGRANAEGTALRLARADHVHDSPISILNHTSGDLDLLATHDYVRVSSSGTHSINLPDPAAVGARRWHILLSHDSAGDVTLVTWGSEEIQGVADNYVITGAWSRVHLVCDGTDWWLF